MVRTARQYLALVPFDEALDRWPNVHWNVDAKEPEVGHRPYRRPALVETCHRSSIAVHVGPQFTGPTVTRGQL